MTITVEPNTRPAKCVGITRETMKLVQLAADSKLQDLTNQFHLVNGKEHTSVVLIFSNDLPENPKGRTAGFRLEHIVTGWLDSDLQTFLFTQKPHATFRVLELNGGEFFDFTEYGPAQ